MKVCVFYTMHETGNFFNLKMQQNVFGGRAQSRLNPQVRSTYNAPPEKKQEVERGAGMR